MKLMTDKEILEDAGQLVTELVEDISSLPPSENFLALLNAGLVFRKADEIIIQMISGSDPLNKGESQTIH